MPTPESTPFSFPTILEQQSIRGKPFPLVLSPGEPNQPLDENLATIMDHRDDIKALLDSHGAILLRGFPVPDADAFQDFLTALDFQYGSYRGGGGPRVMVKGAIHTSTETPPDVDIPMHHELAYLTVTPATLAFFCESPPASEGFTPLLDSNTLYEAIKAGRPDFIDKLERHGVRYIRVLKDKSTCDFKYQRSWEEALETSDKTTAEERMKEVGGEEIEWMEDGSMKVVSRIMPAIITDHRTELPIFFNSVVLLHPAIRGTKADESLWAPCYGNGEEIDGDDVIFALETMRKLCVKFPYQQGDIVLVDNKLALHGRTPFVPPRRILAAISGP